jgi:putative oxidoreductase
MNGRTIDLRARADVLTITALRIGVGVILAVHGAMKVMDIPGTVQGFTALGIPKPEYAVYLAIAGELLGGLGLVVGLLTRVAAFGTFSAMAVAIAYAHWGHGLLTKSGGMEYPLVLALASLFFISHGAGPVSLDALASRRREGRVYRAARVRSYA